MTKFSWEPLDGGSLSLKISDGDRETTWKITKRTSVERIRNIFWEMESALDELTYERIPGVNARPTETEMNHVYGPRPMRETVRTVDAEELAEIQRAYTEEDSRRDQAAYVAKLNAGAKWYEDDDEESMFVALLPDYDAGEI